MTRWRRADPVDLAWRGIRYTRAYVGLEMPTAERVRRALALVATASPQIGRRVDEGGHARWQPVAPAKSRDAGDLAAWLDTTMTVSEERGAGAEHAFALAAGVPEGLRFSVVVGPDWIAADVDHALGDGRSCDLFVGHLLRQAAADEVLPLPWTPTAPLVRDLTIAGGVARSLGSLPYVLRHRRSLAGGAYAPVSAHADLGEPRTVVATSGDGFVDALRAHRSQHHRGASAGSVVAVGLRAALAEGIGTPRRGFECLFNTRLEHGGGLPAWGNWSVGVYLTPDDDLDPVTVTAAIAQARARGLPAYALASLRSGGQRRASHEPHVATGTGVPRLTVSYAAGHSFDAIPGLQVGRSSIASLTQPNGPDSISLHAVEVAGRLTVSTAFYPTVWPEERVTEAVSAFLATPGEFVAAGGGQRPARRGVRS